MKENIKPVHDYVLARKIERDTGVVVGSDIRDTHQLFEVLAVGEGRVTDGQLVFVPAKVGDRIWVQKHADADNPKELENNGVCLLLGSRIMAIEGGDNE